MGNSTKFPNSFQVFSSFVPQQWQNVSKTQNYEIWSNPSKGISADVYALPHSISSEDLEHYQLRHNNDKDIVKVHNVRMDKDGSLCARGGKDYVYVERIIGRLGDIGQGQQGAAGLREDQALSVLRSAYGGFNTISNFYGAVEPYEDMICFNQEGKTKVWVNSNLAENGIEKSRQINPGNNPNANSIYVNKILNMVENKTVNRSLPQKLKNKFRQSNPKNFFQALNLVQEYAAQQHIQIPYTIRTTRFSDASNANPHLGLTASQVQNYNYNYNPVQSSSNNLSVSNMPLATNNMNVNINQGANLNQSGQYQPNIFLNQSTPYVQIHPVNSQVSQPSQLLSLSDYHSQAQYQPAAQLPSQSQSQSQSLYTFVNSNSVTAQPPLSLNQSSNVILRSSIDRQQQQQGLINFKIQSPRQIASSNSIISSRPSITNIGFTNQVQSVASPRNLPISVPRPMHETMRFQSPSKVTMPQIFRAPVLAPKINVFSTPPPVANNLAETVFSNNSSAVFGKGSRQIITENKPQSPIKTIPTSPQKQTETKQIFNEQSAVKAVQFQQKVSQKKIQQTQKSQQVSLNQPQTQIKVAQQSQPVPQSQPQVQAQPQYQIHIMPTRIQNRQPQPQFQPLQPVQNQVISQAKPQLPNHQQIQVHQQNQHHFGNFAHLHYQPRQPFNHIQQMIQFPPQRVTFGRAAQGQQVQTIQAVQAVQAQNQGQQIQIVQNHQQIQQAQQQTQIQQAQPQVVQAQTQKQKYLVQQQQQQQYLNEQQYINEQYQHQLNSNTNANAKVNVNVNTNANANRQEIDARLEEQQRNLREIYNEEGHYNQNYELDAEQQQGQQAEQQQQQAQPAKRSGSGERYDEEEDLRQAQGKNQEAEFEDQVEKHLGILEENKFSKQVKQQQVKNTTQGQGQQTIRQQSEQSQKFQFDYNNMVKKVQTNEVRQFESLQKNKSKQSQPQAESQQSQFAGYKNLGKKQSSQVPESQQVTTSNLQPAPTPVPEPQSPSPQQYTSNQSSSPYQSSHVPPAPAPTSGYNEVSTSSYQYQYQYQNQNQNQSQQAADRIPDNARYQDIEEYIRNKYKIYGETDTAHANNNPNSNAGYGSYSSSYGYQYGTGAHGYAYDRTTTDYRQASTVVAYEGPDSVKPDVGQMASYVQSKYNEFTKNDKKEQQNQVNQDIQFSFRPNQINTNSQIPAQKIKSVQSYQYMRIQQMYDEPSSQRKRLEKQKQKQKSKQGSNEKKNQPGLGFGDDLLDVKNMQRSLDKKYSSIKSQAQIKQAEQKHQQNEQNQFDVRKLEQNLIKFQQSRVGSGQIGQPNAKNNTNANASTPEPRFQTSQVSKIHSIDERLASNRRSSMNRQLGTGWKNQFGTNKYGKYQTSYENRDQYQKRNTKVSKVSRQLSSIDEKFSKYVQGGAATGTKGGLKLKEENYGNGYGNASGYEDSSSRMATGHFGYDGGRDQKKYYDYSSSNANSKRGANGNYKNYQEKTVVTNTRFVSSDVKNVPTYQDLRKFMWS